MLKTAENFWDYTLWGNTAVAWAWALGVMVGGVLLVQLLKVLVLGRLKKWSANTKNQFDDVLVEMAAGPGIYLLYLVLFKIATATLTLPPKAEHWLQIIITLGFSLIAIYLLTAFLKKLVLNYLKKQENGEAKQTQVRGLLIIVNGVIWMLGIVFALNNLGYNVTAIITGLGIGGIAIALAAQAILTDLFSYFVIFFDRPFEVGDFIVVGDKMGTVEAIGIKTTRLRTLSGEQLVCSNTFLTNAQVHNFKRMEVRRVLFTIGVTYQTSYEKVVLIPKLVRQIIEGTEGVYFDRGNFSAFGNSSLSFEFVYFVKSADYNIYMNKQEEIYLNVLKQFTEQKIDFAYPTQTLFVNMDEQKQEKENE